ncbi:protein bicaudal C homolog 1-A-like [Argiope bruennichi]|uniref:protein bicaudal C homolog 1-A-like n=1 Tax=Argiope bruennichi TaxID=94029 RepID=UPI002493DD39|nr:protein bicaudal C homolog 1-A-like [Argiope bruennichi]
MEIVIKLDRLKLPNASNSPAENIFQEISKETGAVVSWESGIKSLPVRREPCIKISGPEEKVNKARDMLLEKLEIQSNRVVMKLEVTHLEHPSLIGKGGKLIKKVMEATGCHIHFPDANKCSILEKKNQVSIYGDPTNVERARVMIRALIPIQIHFEVPKTSFIDTQVLNNIHPNYDCYLPETKYLGSYNGLLIYSSRRQSSNIVIVRCNQDQFSHLRKDITKLMELICCTNGANLPPVHMVTDIMQQHHSFVKGPNNYNIEGIVKRTGAKITFPDINTPKSEKRSIKISGSLDSVYVAWLEIMNFLPVNVSFDVNGTRETKGEYMDFLRDLGITLYTRPNPKYYTKNVILKGPEKFSKQMLQYRQHLLHLPSLCFKADVEDINLASNFLISLSEYFQSTNAIHFKIQSSSSLLALEQSSSSGTGQTSHNENGCCWKSKMENSNTHDQLLTNNNWIKNIPFENEMISFTTVSSGFAEISHDQSLIEQNSKSSRLPQSLFMENQNRETTLAEDYYRKKVLAARAMRRPIESMESAQVPTSLWAGYGFSQSMPAAVIKDSLDSVNHYNRYHFNSCSSNSSSEDSESWENVVMKDCIDGDIWSNKKETTFSHSNYFDFLRNMRFPFDNTTKDILPELLWQHGLHKYIDTFTKEEIDFQSFLLLTDNDLQIMGIAHQARVKLVCLIRELQESTMKYKTFDAAPGAERKSSIDRLDNLQIC